MLSALFHAAVKRIKKSEIFSYWGVSQDRLYSTAALQEILISVKVLTGPVFML